MGENPVPADYPLHSTDKLRYGDTDRQGHVNNAVFATLLETGRVELFHGPGATVLHPGVSVVIARLCIDFVNEIRWPGSVDIGTRVAALGRSSIRLDQALFQNGVCVAKAESVIVLTSEETRRSHPLSPEALDYLGRFMGAAAKAD